MTCRRRARNHTLTCTVLQELRRKAMEHAKISTLLWKSDAAEKDERHYGPEVEMPPFMRVCNENTAKNKKVYQSIKYHSFKKLGYGIKRV